MTSSQKSSERGSDCESKPKRRKCDVHDSEVMGSTPSQDSIVFNLSLNNKGSISERRSNNSTGFDIRISNLCSKPETDSQNRTVIHNYLANTKCSSQCLSTVRDLAKTAGGQAFVYQDYRGMTPLHYACASHSDPSILEALISFAPSASSIPDLCGNLPLHHYIGCHVKDGISCAESILILNKSNQKALVTRNNEGDIPLHLLCKKWHPDEIGDSLLQANDETVKICDRQGRLPLAIACEWRVNRKLIISMCELYPEAASVKDLYGDVPLHILCRTYPEDVPDKAIFFALTKASPKMISIPNADGTLPIQTACEWILATSKVVLLPKDRDFFHWPHFLCEHMCSLDILVCFLEAAPDVTSPALDFMCYELKKRHSHEYSHLVTALALEFLIKTSTPIDVGKISYNIPKCNQDFKFVNRRHLLRAALSMESPLSFEVFMILFGNQWADVKDLVKEKLSDTDATLPLHEVARAGKNMDSQITRYILNLYPEAAKQLDSNMKIPLRLAVENKMNFNSIKLLFDANTSPILMSCEKDRRNLLEIPLWLAAAVHDADTEVIYFLLQSNPSVIQL